MNPRQISLTDRIVGEIDKAIKVLTVQPKSGRDLPVASAAAPALSEAARTRSVRLMRVNHAGEVAAQALYQGQTLGARDPAIRDALQHAAQEEIDHLAWCAQRLTELNAKPSRLNPLWYAGSFALGAAASAISDRASLGLVAETERQVESHLSGHLERLDPTDERTRAIVERMKDDEARHGAMAGSLGAQDMPIFVKWVMRATAKLMTRTSHWF
jgi:ubiquinone biosynthesis monooxygenase Coq7